ncbi:serine protease inhibitor swm-1-like [Bufo bufo]|uniref:serine protease inhibitor swm-1-like n=1 Tax=Bufo bufo TaxID=8384 RepID=UPI001ABED19E|nr:serine protease inhibitor swm-1-like [Bufo bufo]
MGFFKLSAVFLLALLLWEVHSNSMPKLNCPPNSSAGDVSPCAKTCANLHEPPAEACIMMAIHTCKCHDGFLAQIGTSGESVQCVKPKDCNVPCGPNQHYDPCNYKCQPTCEEQKDRVCTKECAGGCVCDKGYVQSGKKCMKPTECKKN